VGPPVFEYEDVYLIPTNNRTPPTYKYLYFHAPLIRKCPLEKESIINQNCCKLIENLFIKAIVTNHKGRNQLMAVQKGLASKFYELSVLLE